MAVQTTRGGPHVAELVLAAQHPTPTTTSSVARRSARVEHCLEFPRLDVPK